MRNKNKAKNIARSCIKYKVDSSLLILWEQEWQAVLIIPKEKTQLKARRHRDLREGEAEIKRQDSQPKNQVPIPSYGEQDTIPP